MLELEHDQHFSPVEGCPFHSIYNTAQVHGPEGEVHFSRAIALSSPGQSLPAQPPSLMTCALGISLMTPVQNELHTCAD